MRDLSRRWGKMQVVQEPGYHSDFEAVKAAPGACMHASVPVCPSIAPDPFHTHLKGRFCPLKAGWWSRCAARDGSKAVVHPALQCVQVLTTQHHQGHALSTVVLPGGGGGGTGEQGRRGKERTGEC